MNDIRVSIFEDNKHIRESLYYLVNGTPGFICTGVYPDSNDVIFQITKDTPDVILMDIEMPGMNGIQAVKLIKSKYETLLSRQLTHIFLDAFKDQFVEKSIIDPDLAATKLVFLTTEKGRRQPDAEVEARIQKWRK